MKRSKRVISIILSIVMVVSLCAGLDFSAYAVPSSGWCGNSVRYTFDSTTGELVISGTGAMSDYFNNPYSPFYDTDNIKKVTINNGVTTIGNYAFSSCRGLTSITIPNSVVTIGNNAFYGCTSLTNVTIPDSITSISNGVFRYCIGLTSVTIPDSVTSIGSNAFYNCTGLKELTMPVSTKIYNNYNTFYNCSNIEKVTLTKGTGTMQDYGTSTSSSSSYTFYGYTPWYQSRANIKEIVIEDGVNNIGNYAFRDCTGLTSVTIPNSVTSIGDFAFCGCEGIKELTMPASAKIYNSSSTFGICCNIEKVTLTKGTGTMQNYSEYSDDSDDSDDSDTYYFCTPWYISRANIKEIVIEDGIENIGDYAFEECTDLTSITIPDSVTSIGNFAFEYCKGLTSATIPDSVTSIGDSAFSGCTGIKELTMPASAKIYNSEYTFDNCTNIEKVTLTKGTGTMQNYTSSSSNSDTYYWFTPWYISNANIKEIVIEDGVNNIGSCAFVDCTGLTSFTIPDSVTSIGEDAFYGCTELTNIYYNGTKADWKNIVIGSYNDVLETSDIICSDGVLCYQHSFTNYVSDNNATCTKNGTGTAKCNKCNETDTITLVNSALGHDLETLEAVDATCFSTGWSEGVRCKRCDYQVRQEKTPMLSHKYKTTVTKATTSKDGKIVKACTNLGCTDKTTTTISAIKTITLSATKYTFDGKTKKPSVKVVGSDGKAISSSNYTVTYPSGRMAPGKYNVKIAFKGNYSGSVTKQFSIVQKATSLSSVTSPAKGKMKISWKKVAGVSGYNVQMSKSSSFASSQTVNVDFGASKTSATGSATSKKKYYVRIRTYKTVKGKKYYSAWSSVKAVTIK